MRILCVLRLGGHYALDYVEHLRDALRQHTPSAVLHCLTDLPHDIDGVVRVQLHHNWPGWWAKIELFRPDLVVNEPTLYLDLDTLVVKDVAPLLRHGHRFTAIRNFMSPHAGMGSGVMAWSGDYSHVYDQFCRAPQQWMNECKTTQQWGDQGFIKRYVPRVEYWQQLFPGAVQSVKQQGDRSMARLLCFHGNPKPRDTNWKPPELPLQKARAESTARRLHKLRRRGL